MPFCKGKERLKIGNSKYLLVGFGFNKKCNVCALARLRLDSQLTRHGNGALQHIAKPVPISLVLHVKAFAIVFDRYRNGLLISFDTDPYIIALGIFCRCKISRVGKPGIVQNGTIAERNYEAIPK